MDWPSDRSQKAQAVLKVPNTRIGKRILVQRIRFEAEALGARQKFEFDRKTGKRFFIYFFSSSKKLMQK